MQSANLPNSSIDNVSPLRLGSIPAASKALFNASLDRLIFLSAFERVFLLFSSKITFYPPSVNQLLRTFVDLGFTSTKPLIVGETTVLPRDFIVAFIQQNPRLREGQKPNISCACNVVVKGKEGSQNVTYTYRFGGWSGPLVSISASLCAQMLCRGEVKVKGVVAPEGAFDHHKYFAELIKRGQVLKDGMPFLEEKSCS